MNKMNDAFLTLVRTINDDPLKVFDDTLTYILRFLSIDQIPISWEHSQADNQAFFSFMNLYFHEQQERTDIKFWHDAWGDLFMELSGNFKSFRGQFFTPTGVADLCAKMGSLEDTEIIYQPIINDCACGSGRMLLAADQLSYENKRIQPYLIGEDIDGMCCKMAAINLAVHGCLGEVVRHDSLKNPDKLLYGYRINETLAAGSKYPSIRRSENKKDFRKFNL